MKSILVILDGAADSGRSAFASAKKPYIDLLASNSSCGLWSGAHATNYNKRSMSSIATLEILGYSENDEPGRGYLEALGLGLKVSARAVCIRGNFATVKDGVIVDRRAGRDETGLDELVHDINRKIPVIDGVKIMMHRLVGHRFVLILEGAGMSRRVSDSDISGRPEKIKPLKKDAAKTAKVLNDFVDLASGIMERHAVNRKRKIPANFILLRSAGSFQKVEKFAKKYHMNACVISGVSIVLGVCRYVGIDVVETPPTELETDLFVRTRKALDALERYDFVVLHINGADTYAHDRDFPGKVGYIEKIDSDVFSQIIKLRNVNIIVISDHITSSRTGEHEFGPVPFLIYDCTEDDETGGQFDEKRCRGSFFADSPMKKIMSLI